MIDRIISRRTSLGVLFNVSEQARTPSMLAFLGSDQAQGKIVRLERNDLAMPSQRLYLGLAWT